MPLPKYNFPLRLPEARLSKTYASCEEAFAAGDYIYTARFGQGEPELHGCALLMLGNCTGGERILNRYNIRTGRSCLYRAFAAWQIGNEDEARCWIKEGRAIGGAGAALDRFDALISKKKYRILVHCNSCDPYLYKLFQFTNVPDIEIIATNHYDVSGFKQVPMGTSLKTFVPPGAPLDLVLVYNFKHFPIGVADLGAPVVVHCSDHDWDCGIFDEIMPEIDWLGVSSTTEIVELAKPFGKQAVVMCFPPLEMPWKIKGLSQIFSEKRERPTDLLFTGGITNDLFRDKRQRILPLAYKLDPQFKARIRQTWLSWPDYGLALSTAKFCPISVRYGNYWSNRSIEALSRGTINIVESECGFPFLFSQAFACFPTYRNTSPLEDIEGHLFRYDQIIEEFIPQAPQLEAEMLDMFRQDETRSMNYLRRLLFVTQVERPSTKPAERPHSLRRECPTNQPGRPQHDHAQVAQFLSLNAPKDGVGRPANWMRMALAHAHDPIENREKTLEAVDEGIKHHPKSFALQYTRALKLRYSGKVDEADDLFRRLVEEDFFLNPDDPFPLFFDGSHGSYWTLDARIRERSPQDLEPFVPEKKVWQSYALSHRADIALTKALPLCSDIGEEKGISGIKPGIIHAMALAKQALEYLMCNNAAQRTYIRAAYALFALGDEKWGEDFLESYETGSQTDGRMLHDFAPLAVDVLTRLKRPAEAQAVTERLTLFMGRFYAFKQDYYYYPEVMGLLLRHNLPSGLFER